MRIQSLSLHNVRGLPSIELDFRDTVTGQPRLRTVIAGSNGSGKTTILEAICELLALLKQQRLGWLSLDHAQAELQIWALPHISDGLAIELMPDSELASVAKVRPINSVLQNPTLTSAPGLSLYMFGETIQIAQQIRNTERHLGNYPNCIYFPSETRRLHPKHGGQVNAEPATYEWVYRFSDTDRWQGSLESFLVAMYFRDLITLYEDTQHGNEKSVDAAHSANEFQRFVKLINGFLMHKQITGVDRQSFRVQIERDDGQAINIDHLSSGEKQIILLLGEIQRRITQGSVLLIDEPEIHMHPRWQRLLVRVLTDLCMEYDAQLIITTQSQEIADAFYEHELILLDDIFDQNQLETNQSSPLEPTPEMTA